MRIQAFLDCDLCDQGSDKCHALAHIQSAIQSMEPGLQDAIVLAIPLGKNQFDLAVQHKFNIKRIEHHFADASYSRLLSSDPLFAAELGRSYPETAVSALGQMIRQYNLVASPVYTSNDPRLIDWFKSEVNRMNSLLEHFRRQLNLV
jgi:hypothetical protein